MRTLVLLLLVGVAAAGLAPLYEVDENVKGSYIIKFKDDLDVDITADDIQRRVQRQRFGRASFSRRYHNVLTGVVAELSEEALQYVRTLDEVEYVSEDGIAYATAIPWGLDRIGQRSSSLDNKYSPDSKYRSGRGVEIWVLDTGVRFSHNDFGGRASFGYDAFGDDGSDCNGHGTHCAGIAAGSTYGVAKKATIKAGRVLGCSGSGSYSGIIGALDHVKANANKPAVVSMSLGGSRSTSLDNAVNSVISAGISVVVAAGNDNANACNTSPARVDKAVTVGSSDKYDRRSSFSNYGSCVDIFAPGSSIPSAYYTSNSATKTLSGTSMACPHVSGIAALYLAESSGRSPATIMNKLKSAATSNALSSVGSGSPNLLAYVDQ
ncbi:uncharacterized protein LOC110990554 [Acanthaster planci]|uniref:Uncharacterized protein LOC110990554 n=1 Tax=Acanthaster planci TaxID=133434 RepID=A0A8B8A1R3_ACAPL|nr:uncharacterized protein LOC110990554 [Acanthaster planci]